MVAVGSSRTLLELCSTQAATQQARTLLLLLLLACHQVHLGAGGAAAAALCALSDLNPACGQACTTFWLAAFKMRCQVRQGHCAQCCCR
jgi:hypothetical protein